MGEEPPLRLKNPDGVPHRLLNEPPDVRQERIPIATQIMVNGIEDVVTVTRQFFLLENLFDGPLHAFPNIQARALQAAPDRPVVEAARCYDLRREPRLPIRQIMQGPRRQDVREQVDCLLIQECMHQI
ncbi:MAG: hypothetical protein Greene041619_265 [Candidatus Peregrinibacteria bacterium Greene0416_19]|nr:MAG: hypothetical protein Greene041619_265 [Candidatus Peregrinibacteria bacterium Greene0416_19]